MSQILSNVILEFDNIYIYIHIRATKMKLKLDGITHSCHTRRPISVHLLRCVLHSMYTITFL